MGVLHWPPQGFWNATVYDVERALTGWKRVNGSSDEDSPADEARRRAWFDSLPETA